MSEGYEVFCHWPAWAQYVWTVGIAVVAAGLGLFVGWLEWKR
jgi:hypothetical protein